MSIKTHYFVIPLKYKLKSILYDWVVVMLETIVYQTKQNKTKITSVVQNLILLMSSWLEKLYIHPPPISQPFLFISHLSQAVKPYTEVTIHFWVQNIKQAERFLLSGQLLWCRMVLCKLLRGIKHQWSYQGMNNIFYYYNANQSDNMCQVMQ